jgi:hypothetical protein
MGMLANERTAREATDALRREKEAHAETNARLTEALLQAEEQRDLLQAALIEAMRQIAKSDPVGVARWVRENMGSNVRGNRPPEPRSGGGDRQAQLADGPVDRRVGGLGS